MSYSFCSDGHFSTTIGRLQYWSALGSFCWSVRLSLVTPCPLQLLQLLQNSSMWQWSRTCVVICCWFQSCDMHCCEVWPCAVSRAVFVSTENYRLSRTMHMHQIVSDWQNWCRSLWDVNICFQRGSNEADCSIWLFCRVQKWNDICQGCRTFSVPAYSRMYRNVGHIYRIWHESRCIIIQKLANELGSLLVYAIKFWHQIEFVIDCVKMSAFMLIDEQKQLELQQCIPGHSEEVSDIHTSFQRSLQITAWDLPAWSRQRSLFQRNKLY